MRSSADNVCSGPAGIRTQVLNTSILEIYTAFVNSFSDFNLGSSQKQP